MGLVNYFAFGGVRLGIKKLQNVNVLASSSKLALWERKEDCPCICLEVIIYFMNPLEKKFGLNSTQMCTWGTSR